MSNEVWVVADLKIDGSVRQVTFEALTEARQKIAGKLGGQLCGVLIGSGVSGHAAELGKYGAEKVYVVDNELLKRFQHRRQYDSSQRINKKYQPRSSNSREHGIRPGLFPRRSCPCRGRRDYGRDRDRFDRR